MRTSISQCVNCAIKVSGRGKRTLSSESESIRQLIIDWTSKELEEDDEVCYACYTLLQEGIETNDNTRQFGCRSVCIPCGKSILHARSRDVTNDSEEKSILAQWIPSHQVKRLERVCYPCWKRACNYLKRQSIPSCVTPTRIKTEDALTEDGDKSSALLEAVDSTASLEAVGGKEKEIPNATISLTTYRRSAASPRHCIFKKCKSTTRLIVPNILKEQLLLEYSFFVSPHARICNEHLHKAHSEWGELYENSNFAEFDATQVENICALLKSSAQRTYCNDVFLGLIKHNNFLCKYWLGVSYEEFLDMLSLIQPIRETLRFPKKSLAVYLMKRRVGYTDEKVASFFRMSLTLMQKNFNIVQQCLQKNDNFVNCDSEITGLEDDNFDDYDPEITGIENEN